MDQDPHPAPKNLIMTTIPVNKVQAAAEMSVADDDSPTIMAVSLTGDCYRSPDCAIIFGYLVGSIVEDELV